MKSRAVVEINGRRVRVDFRSIELDAPRPIEAACAALTHVFGRVSAPLGWAWDGQAYPATLTPSAALLEGTYVYVLRRLMRSWQGLTLYRAQRASSYASSPFVAYAERSSLPRPPARLRPGGLSRQEDPMSRTETMQQEKFRVRVHVNHKITQEYPFRFRPSAETFYKELDVPGSYKTFEYRAAGASRYVTEKQELMALPPGAVSPELADAILDFGDAMRGGSTLAEHAPAMRSAIEKALREAYQDGARALVKAYQESDGDMDRALDRALARVAS